MLRALFGVIAFVLAGPWLLVRSDAGERTLCEEGVDVCMPDTLAVRFGDPSGRVSRVRANFLDQLDVFVTLDVISEGIQGWSFGLRHDPELLEVLEVTTAGLGLPAVFFESTGVALGASPAGVVTAFVLSIFPPPALQLSTGAEIPLLRVRYRVISQLAPDSVTLLRVDSTLASIASGEIPVGVGFTVNSESRLPRLTIDGEIVGAPPEGSRRFLRGDSNGDGRLDLGDAVLDVRGVFFGEKRFDCDDMLDANDSGTLTLADPVVILSWLFLSGPDLPSPFPSCGFDDEADLDCEESNCAGEGNDAGA